jgi:hypothetical protein
MTVYVDELFVTNRSLADPQANRNFGNGKKSCHMTADTADELHAFAKRIGLKREWAQHVGRPTLHYDLTPRRRAAAVQNGAVETSARLQVIKRQMDGN